MMLTKMTGMSANAFAWGMANILAPMMRGLFARPTVTLPEFFPDADGLFGRKPYLLPTLVVFIWGAFATVLGVLYLPADELSWSQALRKALGRGEYSADYAALSTADEDSEESDQDGNRTPRGSKKETGFQSYMRILGERETRLAVSTRVLLPMVWVTYLLRAHDIAA